MKSVFCHIDLDAFYASVEQIDNPSLKGKPVIVGALPGNRGVVSACSYEARCFGIHSAMPVSQAVRKCPEGVFLPVRMRRYLEISENIMHFLKQYTPDFMQISVDEAFLDITGTERLFGPPLTLASEIKKGIKNLAGLTASVGIAPNKYLSKLASEHKKPDGLYMIKSGEEESFLDRIKLKDLWGVGKQTLKRLSELNITSIQNLRKFPLNILISMLGDATGRFLYNAVRGISPEVFSMLPKSHSISNEITFENDRKDLQGLYNVILELSSHIMYRLLKEKAESKTVFLKLRYHDFTTVCVQHTLRHNVTSTEEIYKTVNKIFEQKWDGHTPVRLIGIGLSNLRKGDTLTQPELFENHMDKSKKAEDAVFKIKMKMDGVKITKASLLSKENTE